MLFVFLSAKMDSKWTLFRLPDLTQWHSSPKRKILSTHPHVLPYL